jgi:hypothetical protein
MHKKLILQIGRCSDNRFMRPLWIPLGLCAISSVAAAPPSSLDQTAIEAACLALLRDRAVQSLAASTRLILIDRTPAKIGFLRSEQIDADLEERSLPTTLKEALWRRNCAGEGWDSKPASFAGFRLDKRISIERTPSTARAWFQPFLPAYSDDERFAVVRGLVGPWAHAASATILLRRQGDQWIAEWVTVTRYA